MSGSPLTESTFPLSASQVPVPEQDRSSARLPSPPTSFIGRDREIEQLVALLSLPEIRLLTLTGPGGVGKTRLALAVASALGKNRSPEGVETFDGGMAFVDLTPLADPDLVLPTIGRAFDLLEGSGRLLVDRLVGHLQERRMLLILDNFERVLDAAPLVAHLLTACPGMTVLTTSREPLRLSAERVIQVQPLPLPSPDVPIEQLNETASTRLFVERARTVHGDFAITPANAPAIVEICRRLDGLPLAIELAAARTTALPPVSLLARLERALPLLTEGARDAPTRQRTMRDAIAWSYDSCTPAEQTMFRQLSVFVGGFTLDAAEHLIGANLDETFDRIAVLVAKCVLRQEEGPDGVSRFRMLETVREFGLERSSESGEETAIRDAHAKWCLAFSERAEKELSGREHAVRLARLDDELPNLRAALDWLLRSNDPSRAMQLAASLEDYWWLRGDPSEGKSWLERSLAAAEHAPSAARATAEMRLAELCWAQGAYRQAMESGERALAAHRSLGHTDGIATSLLILGRVASDTEDPRAEALYRESLQLFRELGDLRSVVRCLANLGLVSMHRGDLDSAAALQEEAFELAQKLELGTFVTVITLNRACIARLRKDFPRAIALYRESLERFAALRVRRYVAENLQGLAVIASEMGAAEEAAQLAGADEAIREAIGLPLVRYRVQLENMQRSLPIILGGPRFSQAWTAGRGSNVETSLAGALEIAARLEQRANAKAAIPHGLTSREIDVLRLLVAGKSNQEIGEMLFISPRTAQTHVTNILAKFDVSSRTEAAVAAIRHGIP